MYIFVWTSSKDRTLAVKKKKFRLEPVLQPGGLLPLWQEVSYNLGKVGHNNNNNNKNKNDNINMCNLINQWLNSQYNPSVHKMHVAQLYATHCYISLWLYFYLYETFFLKKCFLIRVSAHYSSSLITM